MNTTSEERAEMVGLAFRQALNSFPIAGPILTGIFFEYRTQLKQKRLNAFVELLEAEFRKLQLNSAQVQTEEASDLFESIFRKVAETRSDKKRIAFKNLLVHGITNTPAVDQCELFSGLLHDLSDKELAILAEHKRYLNGGKGALTHRNELKSALFAFEQKRSNEGASATEGESLRAEEALKAELTAAQNLYEEYERSCTAETFDLSPDIYRYYLQNLFSKGLLFDDGVGTFGHVPFTIMSLTPFGNQFLQYIQTD